MWINLGNGLSYNKTFTYVLGQRSGGKTFGAKVMSITKFKKLGKTTIWLRREKIELSSAFRKKFFEDVQYRYPDDTFEVKETEFGAVALINGVEFIYFVGLKTAIKHKSIPFHTVWWIVFDEFIVKPSVQRYLKDEVFIFMEYYHTVARPYTVLDDTGNETTNDPKTRCVFLGNSISIVNPYFIYFKMTPDKYREFNVYDNVLVWFWQGKQHAEFMKSQSLGQAIEGTDYGDYATHNEFLLDNDLFIEHKSKDANYICGFTVGGYKIGCWIDYKKGLIYVNNQVDPTNMLVTVTTDDHQPNLLMIQHFKRMHSYKQIKLAFENGLIRYNNHLSKQALYDAMSYVRS